MAPKDQVIVGLDIGTTTISVVVAQHTPEKNLEIVGVGTSPSCGLRKGVVINIESTVESIGKAIAQAEAMAGCEVTNVFAAISGNHIKGFNSHGIVGIRNKEVSQYDIDKVIDAAKAVAIPLDRELLHVLPQEFIIDEQDGIKEPLGISGVRLEAKVHIVTGAVASAQNIVKCANRCGLAVQDIVLASLASGHSVVSDEERELGVCLIDVGGGTTDIAIYNHGGVQHTAVVPVGGSHITNDIAAGLRTPYTAAEEIKCHYGTALASLVSRDETIEVPSTGGREPRVLSKQVLSEIIEPRVMEIFNLVQKEIIRSGCDEILTSGLVLTGGTANLRGIEQVAQQVFNLPVRVGASPIVKGLSDLVNSPEYATAVGLAIHGHSTAGISRWRHKGKPLAGTLRKVGNWFSEHF